MYKSGKVPKAQEGRIIMTSNGPVSIMPDHIQDGVDAKKQAEYNAYASGAQYPRYVKPNNDSLVTARAPQSELGKMYDGLVNPMEALSYAVNPKKRAVGRPDYLNEHIKRGTLNRNGLDMAVDTFNPASLFDFSKDFGSSTKDGDYVTDGMRALSAVPMVRGAAGMIKPAVRAAGRYGNTVPRTVNKTEEAVKSIIKNKVRKPEPKITHDLYDDMSKRVDYDIKQPVESTPTITVSKSNLDALSNFDKKAVIQKSLKNKKEAKLLKDTSKVNEINNHLPKNAAISIDDYREYKEEFKAYFGKIKDERDLVLFIKKKKQTFKKPTEVHQPIPESILFEKNNPEQGFYDQEDGLLYDAYTRGYDSRMNKVTRKEYNKKFYKNLVSPKFEESILKNKIEVPTRVTRGEVHNTDVIVRRGGEKIKIKFDDMQEGDIEIPKKFLSTTLKKVPTFGKLQRRSEITLPKGQSYGYPNRSTGSNFPDEHEITLPKKLEYRIDKVNEYKQPYIYDMSDKEILDYGFKRASNAEAKDNIVREKWVDYLQDYNSTPTAAEKKEFFDNIKLTKDDYKEFKYYINKNSADKTPVEQDIVRYDIEHIYNNNFVKFSKSIVNPYTVVGAIMSSMFMNNKPPSGN